ncbi:MAG: hypothetical protein PHD44_10190 [Halothiobacillus sp.]|nr:hypothetical protein [Halothiobacillus sp.]
MSEAFFFMFLRNKRKDFVKGFREWLGQNSLEELKSMIQNGEFPALKEEWVNNCIPYKGGIKAIPFPMFFEFIAEASPELADHINSLGYEGGVYLGELRNYFIECLDHPENMRVTTGTPAAEPDAATVIATCDKCGKTVPIKKSDLDQSQVCPFCNA